MQPKERMLSGRINSPLTPMVLKLNFQQAHTGVEFAVHTFLAMQCTFLRRLAKKMLNEICVKNSCYSILFQGLPKENSEIHRHNY